MYVLIFFFILGVINPVVKKKNLMGKFLGEPLAAIAHTFLFKYKSQGTLVASNFLALSVTSVYDSLIVD